jgi:DMSO/TMAO reductase YedYZ molybdopterin-dependent catalytic subunit
MVFDKLSGWLIGRSGTRPAPMEASVADKDTPVIDARPADRDRVPPRQVKTEKWPVLHYGDVPRVDLATWKFAITGLVEEPFELTYAELMALPHKETLCDIHCVTRWSRLDNKFTGVSVQDLLRRARVKPGASHVLVHAEQGFTTNLPLSDLDRPENLLTWAHNGQPLTPDHGWPLRLLVPHLYFWKSAKWVRGLELLDFDLPGFWEQNGYHMRGDPWAEERYGGMSITQAMINKMRAESKTE